MQNTYEELQIKPWIYLDWVIEAIHTKQSLSVSDANMRGCLSFVTAMVKANWNDLDMKKRKHKNINLLTDFFEIQSYPGFARQIVMFISISYKKDVVEISVSIIICCVSELLR